MQSLSPVPADRVARSVDQRVILHGVNWEGYEAVLELRGESSAIRIAYLEGELELMSPSRDHETIKTRLARLLEAYAVELGIDLNGFGSWTIKERKEERGAEPDECYSIGQPRNERPDVAIEVVWTSGGLDKLEIYRRLGVREVWIWRDGRLEVWALRRGRYVTIEKSELLPQIDFELLLRYLDEPSQLEAVRRLQSELRGKHG